MTRKKAIKELKGWRSVAIFDGEKQQSMKEVNPKLDEALNMAIEALNEKKVGIWAIRKSKTSGVLFYHCSCCEWCNTHWVKYQYCPICGARMEAADEQ